MKKEIVYTINKEKIKETFKKEKQLLINCYEKNKCSREEIKQEKDLMITSIKEEGSQNIEKLRGDFKTREDYLNSLDNQLNQAIKNGDSNLIKDIMQKLSSLK